MGIAWVVGARVDVDAAIRIVASAIQHDSVAVWNTMAVATAVVIVAAARQKHRRAVWDAVTIHSARREEKVRTCAIAGQAVVARHARVAARAPPTSCV